MAQLLYPQGKNSQHLFDRRFGGSQSWSGCGSEENIPALLGIETWSSIL